MAVYLVQHGLSLPKDEDPERGLSEARIADVRRIDKFEVLLGKQLWKKRPVRKVYGKKDKSIILYCVPGILNNLRATLKRP